MLIYLTGLLKCGPFKRNNPNTSDNVFWGADTNICDLKHLVSLPLHYIIKLEPDWLKKTKKNILINSLKLEYTHE